VNHETRCPWIRQNDVDSESHTPFLCGAAAAQMILYGRHDARFEAGSSELATTLAVQRTDQDAIWQAIIEESKVCPLPAGVSYAGDPEAEQIREGDLLSWSTFPRALARLLARGVPLASGDLAGVAATARSLGSETSMENAIVASLRRGVAAALLIDGSHWVVVYRYDVDEDDDAVSIYFRDGLMPKVQSNVPLGLSTFESELSAVADGLFDGRYVAVTASSSVPVVAAEPHAVPEAAPEVARRPIRRRLRRLRRLPEQRERVPFPDRLGIELPAILARNRQWRLAFREARPRVVLPVRLRSGRGPGFYAVNFVSDRGGRSVRTGSAIVDASTLQPLLVAGIDNEEQELPQLLDADEARKVLVERASRQRASAESAWAGGAGPSYDDAGQEAGKLPQEDPLKGIDPASLSLDGDLTWSMCDQSTSPFLPFFVVKGKDAHTGTIRTLYLRADGGWLGEITRRMAGI
jgi:hypothetical protein